MKGELTQLISKKLLLTAVFIVLVGISLAGCGKLQDNKDIPEPGVQPNPPAAAEITAEIDQPDTGLNSPDHLEIEVRLPLVYKHSDPDGTGGTTVDIYCTGTDPHPIGQSIAGTYAVPYQQVMTWFCSGYSFENILVALETSEAVDIKAETLLLMLLDKEWEEIWDEIGFIENR
jgi:hypothetical protein